jgi:hypothetical protein
MPAKRTTGGISAAEVATKLPNTFFVMRGHLEAAFGFSRRELERLIAKGIFVAKYPFGTGARARFVRTQVLAVARDWEAGTQPIPK